MRCRTFPPSRASGAAPGYAGVQPVASFADIPHPAAKPTYSFGSTSQFRWSLGDRGVVCHHAAGCLCVSPDCPCRHERRQSGAARAWVPLICRRRGARSGSPARGRAGAGMANHQIGDLRPPHGAAALLARRLRRRTRPRCRACMLRMRLDELAMGAGSIACPVSRIGASYFVVNASPFFYQPADVPAPRARDLASQPSPPGQGRYRPSDSITPQPRVARARDAPGRNGRQASAVRRPLPPPRAQAHRGAG